MTGDYPKKVRVPRLALELKAGHLELYSCSLRFLELSNAKELFDYRTDIMSDAWDEKEALEKLKNVSENEIGDVLLDQTIFTGVGNIIRNEVLLLAKTSPIRKIKEISTAKLKKIIKITRLYVFQFYEWRKNFELKKHYKIYRQKFCKQCGGPVIRKKTGARNRVSFICARCEK